PSSQRQYGRSRESGHSTPSRTNFTHNTIIVAYILLCVKFWSGKSILSFLRAWFRLRRWLRLRLLLALRLESLLRQCRLRRHWPLQGRLARRRWPVGGLGQSLQLRWQVRSGRQPSGCRPLQPISRRRIPESLADHAAAPLL